MSRPRDIGDSAATINYIDNVTSDVQTQLDNKGYINIPANGPKTSSYTLQTSDVGKYIEVGSGGSITIPDSVFSAGDVVSIVNNTTGDITITCSITTAYKGGANTDEATITLATRGIATVLFISSTVCIVNGNI